MTREQLRQQGEATRGSLFGTAAVEPAGFGTLLTEAVHGAVRMALGQQTYVTALRQYLQVLAGNAVVEGVDLDAADTPLVQ